MSQHGEAAEQIVNMATNVTVKGVECLTNLAGRGALSLATFLIAALKDEKRTSGKARMRAFNGKPTKVFAIKPRASTGSPSVLRCPPSMWKRYARTS